MQTTCTPDRPLDLEPLLPGLLAHGLITPTHADQALKRYRAAPNNGVHPLIFLAAQQFADLSRPGKPCPLNP